MAQLMAVLMVAVPVLFGAGWIALVIRDRRQEELFRSHGRM